MFQVTFGQLLLVAPILGALALVIFNAGRLDARVSSLEEWRADQKTELNAIHASIRNVEAMIRGEQT